MKRVYWESERDGGKYIIELVSKKRGTASQYIFKTLDGNGVTGEAQIVKPPNYDGAITYGVTRSSRDIRLEGTIISYGSRDKWVGAEIIENRDYLAKCFDPKYYGTLYYYTYPEDIGRKIRCRPTALPVCEDDFGNITEFKIGFISDESYWVSVNPIQAAMGFKQKWFRFPHGFYKDPTGIAFTRAILNNPTLYNIRPVIMLFGHERAIEIHNKTTGAFLIFKFPLDANERITIDTKNVRAYIEDLDEKTGGWIFRENILHRMTLNSDIKNFILVPGKNIITLEKHLPEADVVLILTGDIPVMGV